MSDNTFQVIAENILTRRTTSVPKMNGQLIPQETIQELLKLADAAPTHARTEPWRFHVYSGESFGAFCINHGDLYWEHADLEKRNEGTKQTLSTMHNKASHLIVAMMRRTPEAKIPRSEEYAATAAAVQNILLGAHAAGLSAIWNTGGMALKQPMKDYLGLKEEDEVLGFVYLGHSDDTETRLPNRNYPLASKVQYFS